MPKIIVCYKWVQDEEDIKVNQESLTLDFSRSKKKISEYDKNALEIAVQLVEQQEGEVTAVSYGAGDLKQSLKDVLSRGADKVIWLDDADFAKADAFVTANVLAAVIKKNGPGDMIICADGSTDNCSQQVPVRIGLELDLPVITAVIAIEIVEDGVIVTRRSDHGQEKLKVCGPAVYGVLPEAAKARVPSLKQVMKAAKKPQLQMQLEALELAAEKMQPKIIQKKVEGYVMKRKNVIFKTGNVQERVKGLLDGLSQEGIF